MTFAKAMNVHAIRCRTAAELPEKMKEFLEYDGSRPVLMECVVFANYHNVPQVRPVLFCLRSEAYISSGILW